MVRKKWLSEKTNTRTIHNDENSYIRSYLGKNTNIFAFIIVACSRLWDSRVREIEKARTLKYNERSLEREEAAVALLIG